MSYETYLANLQLVSNTVVSTVTDSFEFIMASPVTGVPVLIMVTGLVLAIVVRLMQGLTGGRKET
jgi:hypothetical protein